VLILAVHALEKHRPHNEKSDSAQTEKLPSGLANPDGMLDYPK